LLPWRKGSNSGDENKEATLSDLSGQPVANDGVSSHAMSRTSGAGVVLINGNLTAFLRRRNQEIQVFLPESEPERTRFSRELAKKLAEIAILRQGRKTGMLIGTINGEVARGHFLARFLEESGFVDTAMGFHMRRIVPLAMLASVISPASDGGVDGDGIDQEESDEEESDEEKSDEENDPEVPETA
jgi:hypothetical protein